MCDDMSSQGLPKVADVEKESLYGYVFGVSGPGKRLSSGCVALFNMLLFETDIWFCPYNKHMY